ncbi:hypothetical protein [Flavobacterium ginsenosidimutans]|uniref:hypothetical protein n=1 Tax=Flavobacterium ginsenosidimutans TaxID=687844 RepID=UPI003D954562
MDIIKISLLLNIFFILVLVFGTIYITLLIKNKTVENEGIDKIIDVFKIAIITTVATIIVNIVSDYFKERDYDKSEMVAFNEYIPYVIDTTGTIDKKINFCKFFASVTPKGDLRDGWEKYTLYLEGEKAKLVNLNETSKAKTLSITNKSQLPTKEELVSLETDEAQKQKILSNLNAVENTSYLVILGADLSVKSATPELEWAKENISSNAVIYKKRNFYTTVIPVNSSYQDAKDLAKKIKTIDPKRDAYVVSSKTWCATTKFSNEENCLICN